MALAYTKGMPLGTPAPDFDLLGVDGARHRLADFAAAPVLVVVFTCNHCPYAIALEERLVQLQATYAPRGVQLVAICSNDHPQDELAPMRVRAAERGFNFPYLRDDTQAVARAYDAACTPDIFVFGPPTGDGRPLVYNGRFDDDWRDARGVTRHDLARALSCALAGQPVDFEPVASMGCSIKWRPAP